MATNFNLNDIYTSGNIGINTISPSGDLHVVGTGIFSELIVNSSPVSTSGHTHISSDLTDFNISVSGLINGIYAPIESPSLSGTPTAPTAPSGTNTNQIASTAFVRTEVSNIVNSAPSTLDTLNELATALGNDANFSTTVTNSLASKANLSGATFTGTITSPSGDFTSLRVNDMANIGTGTSTGNKLLITSNNSRSYSYILASGGVASESSLARIVNESNVTNDSFAGLLLSANRISSNVAQVGLVSAVATNASTYQPSIVFTARTGASTYSELMRIHHNGNIGIGNNAPSYKLDVAGTGNFSQNLLVNGTGVSLSGHIHSVTDITNLSKTFCQFTSANNQPPLSNFATIDTRNTILVLDFDDSAVESSVFVGIVPDNIVLTSGITVRIIWMATSATSGNVRWRIEFEKGNTDYDSDSFDTAVEATATASATAGIPTYTDISSTNIDSLSAGDIFRLKISRVGTDGTNDTMAGDAELIAVSVRSN